MEFLKDTFGEKALTFSEFENAVKGNKNLKLANLASGDYVDKNKYAAKEAELTAANGTIAQLQEAVKKFDGVDIEALKSSLQTLQSKYDADIASVKKDSAISIALANAKAKNIKAVKALLDESKISIDGDNVVGLEDQLSKIKKDNDYLFASDTQQPSIEKPSGSKPGASQPKEYLDSFYANNPFYKK